MRDGDVSLRALQHSKEKRGYAIGLVKPAVFAKPAIGHGAGQRQ